MKKLLTLLLLVTSLSAHAGWDMLAFKKGNVKTCALVNVNASASHQVFIKAQQGKEAITVKVVNKQWATIDGTMNMIAFDWMDGYQPLTLIGPTHGDNIDLDLPSPYLATFLLQFVDNASTKIVMVDNMSNYYFTINNAGAYQALEKFRVCLKGGKNG